MNSIMEQGNRPGLGTFAFVLLLTFAAAFIGAAASIRAGQFYQALDRPAWAPPSAVFGPVWTVLYVLMAVAAFLVIRRSGWGSPAIVIHFIQLVLNALWTWLFFAWRRGGLAFADIVALLVLLGVMTILFWRVQPLAGALVLPYLAWVTFATFLTWSVWTMNPGVLT